MIFSWSDIKIEFLHTFDKGRSRSVKMHSLGSKGIKISPLIGVCSPPSSSFIFKFEGGGLGVAATSGVKGQRPLRGPGAAPKVRSMSHYRAGSRGSAPDAKHIFPLAFPLNFAFLKQFSPKIDVLEQPWKCIIFNIFLQNRIFYQ